MEDFTVNYKREDIYNQERIDELMMHYREISLDLDFLMGATDVLSNRLSAHLKNQQEDV